MYCFFLKKNHVDMHLLYQIKNRYMLRFLNTTVDIKMFVFNFSNEWIIVI